MDSDRNVDSKEDFRKWRKCMFKAIIADDEIRICMLLQRLIDWSAMEIEIVGECHD